MTQKWSWRTEKWNNLKPISISPAKVLRVQTAAKVEADVGATEALKSEM